jgi:hypothetical protein
VQDLFTVKHSSFPAPGFGWQMGLPQGMGISMQYNNAMVLLQSRMITLPDYLSMPLDDHIFVFQTAYD